MDQSYGRLMAQQEETLPSGPNASNTKKIISTKQQQGQQQRN